MDDLEAAEIVNLAANAIGSRGHPAAAAILAHVAALILFGPDDVGELADIVRRRNDRLIAELDEMIRNN
jgi:hypothetical protein